METKIQRGRMNSSIKQIAEEYAHRIWNNQDLTVIDRLLHPDVLIHSLLGDFRGSLAMKEVVKAWLKGFPDLKVDNDHMISENDLVCLQWRARGTHRGEFKGRPPSGKSVSYSGMTVYRIVGGQIVEYWAYLDMQHLFNQMN